MIDANDAVTLNGTATSATRLTTESAGSSTKPVYFNNGIPVVCADTLANNISGTAAKVQVTNRTPSAAEQNYLPYVTSASSGSRDLYTNNGLQYYTKSGTASSVGEGQIILGNSIAQGVTGNARGALVIYGTNTGGTWIYPSNASTSNNTLYLPTGSGTLALLTSNVASATQLQTPRAIEISNDATGSATFNGTADAKITLTISNSAVTTDKIKNASVTEAKIADANVTTDKIKDGNVTTNKIKDGNVTNNKIATNTITNNRLVNSSISIADQTVSLGGSLAAGTLRTALGLSNAMHFIGIATVSITDGSTTDPGITGYVVKTDRLYGDVVIDKDTSYEYVWTTNGKWERLGPDGSYKTLQSVVTLGNVANGSGHQNTFISQISQNANGVISVGTATLGKLTINGQEYNGANDVKIGTLGVAYGGTGRTSLVTPTVSWTNGTTAGPTLTIKDSLDRTSTAVAIPVASADTSGVVTTGNQVFTGTKIFQGLLYTNNQSNPAIYFRSNKYNSQGWLSMGGKKANFGFSTYSLDSSGARTEFLEQYYLPETTVGLTSNVFYNILTTKDYNRWVPSLDGAGAKGTWNININGNAECDKNGYDIYDNYAKRYAQTVDLTALDVNTWYPVYVVLPHRGVNRVACTVMLDSESTPSWSSHDRGFTAVVELLVVAGGWGTARANTICLVNDQRFIKEGESPAVGYRQHTNGSCATFYCRGGARYNLETSFFQQWTILTTATTVVQTTIEPTTTYPDLSFIPSVVTANISGDLYGSASCVRDTQTDTPIYLTYSASAMTSTNWLGSWDGNHLRTISPANITAGKATADADGNNIASTYLKRTGGTMTGNISFQSITDTATSHKITWSGSTDGAEIFYRTEGADKGRLFLNMIDDSDPLICFAWNGTTKAYINADGYYSGYCERAWRDSDGLLINSNYLKLSGGTLTGRLTIQKSSTIAGNAPAEIAFANVDTDNNITTSTSAFIRTYDDHDGQSYGLNMVIQSGGNLFIGSGESSLSVYKQSFTDSRGEDTYVCADGCVYFYTNCNQIANKTTSCYINTSGVLYGACWNDYAEYRASSDVKPGFVVVEKGDDTLELADGHMLPACSIVSDTYGFCIGETKQAKTPVAVSGRVLAYCSGDRNSYRPGDAVCSDFGGKVTKMTREEIKEYPDRIIGYVSSVPAYDTWGEEDVAVNGRIWIKVK